MSEIYFDTSQIIDNIDDEVTKTDINTMLSVVCKNIPPNNILTDNHASSNDNIKLNYEHSSITFKFDLSKESSNPLIVNMHYYDSEAGFDDADISRKYNPLDSNHTIIKYLDDTEKESQNIKPWINCYDGLIYPTIHWLQLFPNYANITNSASDNLSIPRKLRFIDSSIWHIAAWDEKSFVRAIKKILKYREYYKLTIAQESAELNRRIYSTSVIYSPCNTACTGSSHGANVVPFVFHSEQKMSQLLSDGNNITHILSAFKKTENKIKWRVLFIDDHHNNFMSGSTTITKGKILDNRISDIHDVLVASTSDNFIIDYTDTTSKAEKKLSERKYDIILIDYLLSEDTNTNIREYGYTILDKIKHTPTLQCNKGIASKYWIMFSTGFTQAIQDRLLSEGYSHSDEDWYIGRAACPTTTPELFKYNLLSLMNNQLKVLLKTNKSVKKDDDETIITLIDFLSYIFEDDTEIRKRAIDNFNSLLNLRAHYNVLKNDFYMGGKKNSEAENNGSPLVQSLFPDIRYYSNAFWEHVQHLIYLIAFGNIRQWNEMWDEYIFIKDILKEAATEAKSDDLHTKIEEYIYKIKSENY